MNPVEIVVAFRLEALCFEHVDTSLGCLEVRIWLVVRILRRVDVGDWRLVRLGVRCDLDLVVQCIPMSTLRKRELSALCLSSISMPAM